MPRAYRYVAAQRAAPRQQAPPPSARVGEPRPEIQVAFAVPNSRAACHANRDNYMAFKRDYEFSVHKAQEGPHDRYEVFDLRCLRGEGCQALAVYHRQEYNKRKDDFAPFVGFFQELTSGHYSGESSQLPLSQRLLRHVQGVLSCMPQEQKDAFERQNGDRDPHGWWLKLCFMDLVIVAKRGECVLSSLTKLLKAGAHYFQNAIKYLNDAEYWAGTHHFGHWMLLYYESPTKTTPRGSPLENAWTAAHRREEMRVHREHLENARAPLQRFL